MTTSTMDALELLLRRALGPRAYLWLRFARRDIRHVLFMTRIWTQRLAWRLWLWLLPVRLAPWRARRWLTLTIWRAQRCIKHRRYTWKSTRVE